ncbi:MAG: hypothetical protein HZB62_02710 [Nitrospirae bacterium]|nr:hypothetical protein [Nitrospirota bacterium]
MVDIDRQIEIAKKKPLTAENLNYIGDLYLKKDDKQRAVAYFFEAADKLHFAQKEKKIAIYKKILKISPVSEKAYIGIIEILSKMGLVMEEKKYLHMLAQLHENRGDSAKAIELLDKIRELDPHVMPDGTFFHREAHEQIIGYGKDSRRQEAAINEDENNVSQPGEQSLPDLSVSGPAEAIEEEKLIVASLEEIPLEEPPPAEGVLSGISRRQYLLGGIILVLLVFASGVLYYSFGTRAKPVASLPVSSRLNGYEITVSRLADQTEVTGLITAQDLRDNDFLVLAVSSLSNCIPDAFATAPYNMISLRDRKGGATRIKPVDGLLKTSRSISKMNVCGRDNAIVFVRMIVPVDRHILYSGLALDGLQNTGPLTITWDLR